MDIRPRNYKDTPRMLDRQNLRWVNEFLHDRIETAADRETVEQIILTFRNLFVVLDASKKTVSRVRGEYEPGSPQDKLQEAISPFYRVEVTRD